MEYTCQTVCLKAGAVKADVAEEGAKLQERADQLTAVVT